MSALREVFAKFGIEMDSGPLVKGDQAVSNLTDRLGGLGTALASSAIVLGLRNFAANFVEQATEISDASQVLGMSSDDLQAWRHAAQLSGVDASALGGAFIRLQDGMAASLPAFRELGVAVRDANGELRPVGDVLADLADPIAALSTDAERTGKLVDLLGRSGARLGPLFARGSEGLAEVRAELALLGGGATPEAIEAADALGDAWDRLDVVSLSLKGRIAMFLLPALERLAAGSTDLGARLTRMTDQGKIAEAALVVLGTAALAAGAKTALAWVAAAAPFVVLGAAILGLIFIVEDLWIGFERGGGVLEQSGRDLDEWAENATGVLEPVAGAWLIIRDAIRAVVQELASITGISDDLLGLNLEGVDTSQQDNAMDEVRRIRAERAAAAERRAAGVVDFVTPGAGATFAPAALGGGEAVGGADRVLGTLGGPRSSGLQLPPQVTQSVRIDTINANGLNAAQVVPVVESAVARALSSQADDTLDALAGGA